MVERGLEAELRELTERYARSAASFNSIGYSDWQPYLEGAATRDDVKRSMERKTMRYAGQQARWLESLDRACPMRWIDLDEPEALADRVAEAFDRSP